MDAKKKPDLRQLLTGNQIAEILQVSRPTAYRMLKRGEIPTVKLGEKLVRVRPQDLEAYIAAHTSTQP